MESVKENLNSVAELAKEFSAKISLAATGELMGMLYDMGKSTRKFDAYIRYCARNPNDMTLKGRINHFTAGPKLIYDSFNNSKDKLQKFAAQRISLTVSSFGGGCINDTIIYLASPNLHFGGVGESGMGQYHGKGSYVTFSHVKIIMKKSNKFDIPLRYPPFKNHLSLLKKLMK